MGDCQRLMSSVVPASLMPNVAPREGDRLAFCFDTTECVHDTYRVRPTKAISELESMSEAEIVEWIETEVAIARIKG